MTAKAFDLTGKLALITGAGSASGIGFQAAKLLAEMGAEVFLTSHGTRCKERAEELRALGHKAHALPADLTKDADIQRLATAVRDIGRVKILVNNAGMTSQQNPADNTGESEGLENTSREAFSQALERNLMSAVMLTKTLLGDLRDGGRVVNITSVTGPVMAMRNEVSYAAAKAAMVGFTRALALDEAANGMTVNAVAPGWIATESQTEHEKLQGEKSPMLRSGTPEEIASAIAYRASPLASCITGQVLVVDGGNSIAEERG